METHFTYVQDATPLKNPVIVFWARLEVLFWCRAERVPSYMTYDGVDHTTGYNIRKLRNTYYLVSYTPGGDTQLTPVITWVIGLGFDRTYHRGWYILGGAVKTINLHYSFPLHLIIRVLRSIIFRGKARIPILEKGRVCPARISVRKWSHPCYLWEKLEPQNTVCTTSSPDPEVPSRTVFARYKAPHSTVGSSIKSVLSLRCVASMRRQV